MKKKLSKKAKKQIWNFAFLFALIAVTLVILFLSNRELDFMSIGDFFRRSNLLLLIPAFVCMLGYILFEALALHVVARTMGHKCNFGNSIVYSSADIYYSAITPSAAGGQPASAYYMVQDGMSSGAASFTLVFNIIAYTAAIIIIGIAAFIINSAMFAQFGSFVKLLVILGLIIQSLLLGFFIACMFCHRAVRKCGNGIIMFLRKIKIIKNEEKWRKKLSGAVDKYAGCLGSLRKHRLLFFIVLIINILQRVSQIMIPCFICAAVVPEVPFIDVFVMQSFVTLGYNSVPLPGGVGAYEYLYMNIYSYGFDGAFILVAMMVARTISYYLSMALAGAITLGYHGRLIRKKGKAAILQAEAEALGEKYNTQTPPSTDVESGAKEPPATEEGAEDETQETYDEV